MALMKIVNWSNNPCDFVKLPIASGTVIKQLDLVSYESNLITVFSTATDDQYFVGLAFGESESGNSDDIVVCTGPVVVNADLSSATYSFGVGILYVSGSNSADWTFADDSGANTVGNIWRSYTSTVTRGRVRFDAYHLAKMFETNA